MGVPKGPGVLLRAAQRWPGGGLAPAVWLSHSLPAPPAPSRVPRRWTEYADRKQDEEGDEEHVANSLLYDRNHLPRTAPPPDCVAQPAPAPAAPQQQQEQS